MSVTTDNTTTPGSEARTRAGSRGWAWAGVLAGVAALAGIQVSLTIDAVYGKEYLGDPVAITERLGELTGNLIAFHVATMVGVVLLPVFGAGLRRRLAEQGPAGSLLPDLAMTGLLLVAVAGLIGTGLDTEFIFGTASEDADLVPEAAVVYAHWVGTVNWLWVGAGLTGVALAVAGLRHAAVPRWIGWVGAVLGGLTLLLGISPLQYMAGFTGPVLLLVVALGFALGDRAVGDAGATR